MIRTAAAVTAISLLAGAAAAAPPAGVTEVPVSVPVPGGGLKGTLWLPKGTGKVPGVVISAGSGNTDRDGNQPTLQNNSLRMLATALAARGIATLRFDKRMVGASRLGPPFKAADIRFDHFVADMALWLQLMKRHPRIARVFAAGHSQGAMVATLAAEREAVAGVILLAGPGEPIGMVIRRQLRAAPSVTPEVLKNALAIIDSLERGKVMADVNPLLHGIFRPAIQPFWISWMKHDPAKSLARLRVPALIVQGDRDLQVKLRDARALKAARPDAKLVLLRGMNHVLKVPAGPGRTANIAAYRDPTLPLAPGLADAVTEFVKGVK